MESELMQQFFGYAEVLVIFSIIYGQLKDK